MAFYTHAHEQSFKKQFLAWQKEGEQLLQAFDEMIEKAVASEKKAKDLEQEVADLRARIDDTKN